MNPDDCTTSELELQRPAISRPALSADGRFVVGTTDVGGKTEVVVLRIANGLREVFRNRVEGLVLKPILSSDGRFLAYCEAIGRDQTLVTWNVGTSVRAAEPLGCRFGGRLAFSSSGSHLAAATFDGVSVRDLSTGETPRNVGVYAVLGAGPSRTITLPMWSLALSDDGDRLVVALNDDLAVWSVSSGTLLAYMQGARRTWDTATVALHPRRDILAVSGASAQRIGLLDWRRTDTVRSAGSMLMRMFQ